jgi:ATP-dependent Lhr-like helicase
MGAEDLIGSVFPDQIACAENLAGDREVPDHPLVRQAIGDCLNEAMDLAGLERVLAGIEAGDIKIVARDLTEPSPLALEALSARPYAYLDDAPLEERRTQAVMSRRWLSPEAASDIAGLIPRRSRASAPKRGRRPPKLTNCTMRWSGSGSSAPAKPGAGAGWSDWLADLARDKRVARLDAPQAPLWITAERLPQFQALWPAARLEPATRCSGSLCRAKLVARRGAGGSSARPARGARPGHVETLAGPLGLASRRDRRRTGGARSRRLRHARALHAGSRGRRMVRAPAAGAHHGYTVKRLRAEIEPVAARDFLRFLLGWQRVAAERPDGRAASGRYRGRPARRFEAPAGAWESEILPARLAGYEPTWLDDRCLAGHVAWTRLRPRAGRASNGEQATEDRTAARAGRRRRCAPRRSH